MQQVALLGCLLYILWLLVRDAKRRVTVSPALWIVLTWLLIIAARGFSAWFISDRQVSDQAASYDEGNPLERNVYLLLMVLGLVTLARRRVRFSEFCRNNKWLVVFFGYWLISTLWSDLPFVSFKRWVKDLGNIVMVLIILTDADPVEAAKAVFVRCACLLLPLSVLFIRYYPDLGRAYDVTGGLMFTGVATQKNTLGILAMVSGLFVMWDLGGRGADGRLTSWIKLFPEAALLCMAVWLLYMSHSATSLTCAFIGIAVFFGLRLPAIKSRLGHLQAYCVVGGLLFLVLNWMFGIVPFVVEHVLARDMTLTSRTDIWPVLLSHSASPLLGAGFNGFWTGERLAAIYGQFGMLQAHNGYLDTYLNGGLIAVLLLLVVLYAASRRIQGELLTGGELPIVRLMFLVIAIIHNFTEASINKSGLVWFSLLLVITHYPRAQALPAVHPSPVCAECDPSEPAAGTQLCQSGRV